MTLGADAASGAAVCAPRPPLLAVEGLAKRFPVRRAAPETNATRRVGLGRLGAHVQAVDGVTFDIARGETLALVGESGCGKSTTARLVLRLLDADAGTITFDGREIGSLRGRALRALRARMQVVFQDPFSALDPRQRVFDAVAEPLVVQGRRREAQRRVPSLLARVGLDPSASRRYPHEFSGGQRQRIGIARALAPGPELVVLDEPVTALDVSVRAQVLSLLTELQRELSIAYLLIAHDLAVVRQCAHRVAVMYLGRIVEMGTADAIYTRARHPYTQALLSAVPDPDPVRDRARERIVLAGEPASAIDPPSGCRFRTRCWQATDRCARDEPPLVDHGDGHLVACHFPAGHVHWRP